MLLGALMAFALAPLGAGIFAAPAVAALVIGVFLRPDLALLALTSLVVLAEGDVAGVFHDENIVYHSVFKGLTALDYLFLLIVLAVAFDLARRRVRPLGVGPLGPALGLLSLALVGGLVAAHAAGIGAKAVFPEGVKIVHVILIPFAVVELIRRRPQLLERAIKVIVVLLALKCAAGVALSVAGARPVVEGQTITFLEPTVNWLVVTFLLVIVARVIGGWRPSRLMLALTLLASLELLLSFRRSFWIAFVIGLVIVLLVGGGRARLMIALAVIALGLGVYVALSGAGGASTTNSPIVARAVSLSPTKLSANAEDRYRLDERRNVLAELRRHPVTGLGIAVPWGGRYPLPLEHPGGRTYVHVVVLYLWLKLGLLGLAAYIALQLGAFAAAARVWRRDPDPLRRALGLGALGSLVGLVVAETTASFTAVDYRFSLIEPIVLGLLAALWLGLGRTADSEAEPGAAPALG